MHPLDVSIPRRRAGVQEPVVVLTERDTTPGGTLRCGDRSGPRPAVRWLVDSGDPAVSRLARRDLVGQDVSVDGALESPIVQQLLDTTSSDVLADPYAKWAGAHWRLVSLVELGVPPGTPTAMRLCDVVVDHWARPARVDGLPTAGPRPRLHASQEGNAVAVACRLGLHADARVRRQVELLLQAQWPDGGWNCDRHPEARVSSVHETLPALWGLAEYAAAAGDEDARRGADRAAHALLDRDVAFSRRTGAPIHRAVLEPHFPPYWHYDVLRALVVLQRAGHGHDPRTARARQVLLDRRTADGRWRAGRRWWRPPGRAASNVEAVDWAGVDHQMVTLDALRLGLR